MEQIRVANVKCGGCAATIRDKLTAMPGVADVTVDIDGGLVTVSGEAVSRPAVEAKLREIGYPPREH